jgi:hypothetical protein
MLLRRRLRRRLPRRPRARLAQPPRQRRGLLIKHCGQEGPTTTTMATAAASRHTAAPSRYGQRQRRTTSYCSPTTCTARPAFAEEDPNPSRNVRRHHDNGSLYRGKNGSGTKVVSKDWRRYVVQQAAAYAR